MAREKFISSEVLSRAGGSLGSRKEAARGGAGGLVININTRELGRIADIVHEAAREFPAATARALSRTARETRTAMKRALVVQTGLRSSQIERSLSVVNASAMTLTAVIVGRGGFVPLRDFAARQTKKGVSAAPWNVRRVFPSTFIIRSFGGHVFRREGRERFPLKMLFGPAIPREMTKDQSADAFYTTAPRVLGKRLEHELSRVFVR